MTDKIDYSREYIFDLFITKNLRIREVAEKLNISYSKTRRLLKSMNIAKSQKLACKNSFETLKERQGLDYIAKRGFGKDSQKAKAAQLLAAEAKAKNSFLKLEKEGLTAETLYNEYIINNKSLKVLSEELAINKSKLRKILNKYSIKKNSELKANARKHGSKKFYSDPENVARVVAKTQSTIKDKYGNNWYRNQQSVPEKEIYEAIELNYKELLLKSGDYSVIKNRKGHCLQLDIYMPTIKLAVEFNGTYWHDKIRYLDDITNGSSNSPEIQKTKFCNEKSITLIHIWSDDYKADKDKVLKELFATIDLSMELIGEINDS